MDTKELKIEVPQGYKIDKENSTFECIKFKLVNKKLTYNDIAIELFIDKKAYYTDANSKIATAWIGPSNYEDFNNCTSQKQAEKLLAINKLMNVAKYLNCGWKPNWNEDSSKYFISIDHYKNIITVDCNIRYTYSAIYFESKELAQQAIDILGEETIRLALSTDW